MWKINKKGTWIHAFYRKNNILFLLVTLFNLNVTKGVGNNQPATFKGSKTNIFLLIFFSFIVRTFPNK